MSDDSGTMDAEPRQGMFSKIGSFLSRSGTVSLPNGSSNSETKPLNPNGKSSGNAEEPMTYEKLLEQAQTEDFTEEMKSNFIYVGGHDTIGRPIVVVVGSQIPAKTSEPNKLLRFVIKIMHPVVAKDYTLIYIHSNFSAENKPGYKWMLGAYKMLNRTYKKNLKQLYIVHPSFFVRAVFQFFRPFLSSKFWQKLNYVFDVNELFKFIQRDQVNLPKFIFMYDKEKQKQGIFGTPLEEVMTRADHQNREIPIVVEQTLKYLEDNKLETIEGIFRLSGSNAHIAQLKKDYDKGDPVDLSVVKDIHVVAGLLKLYLRELPEPLIPFELHDALVEAFRGNNDIKVLTPLLQNLPPVNKSVLRNIMRILKRIMDNVEQNKMTSSNLSIIFAPNLLRSQNTSVQQTFTEAPLLNSLTRCLLDNADAVLQCL